MSIYVPTPGYWDYVFRLQPFQIEGARIADYWTPFEDVLHLPPQFAPPWDREYHADFSGYFAVDVVVGRTYEFMTYSFFPPSILLYDADGFQFKGTTATDSLASLEFVALETGRIYVLVSAQHAYAHSNPDLTIFEDVDLKPNTIVGTAERDFIQATAGFDVINAGLGVDFVTFAGNKSRYHVEILGATTHVTDTTTGVTDTLLNVERLIFDDVRTTLTVSVDAPVYRLYRAAFDRTPDLAGLGYQLRAVDGGLALNDLAKNFISSPEFASKYGAVTDTQFVQQLYQNVLDRAPDAGGLAYHVDHLAHGFTRADVLVGFSESPENQAAVIGAISNGIDYLV